MTAEEFQTLIARCQPHRIFNSDWDTFYSIDFAETLLPQVEGYTATAVKVFDGAELFRGVVPTEKQIYKITDSKSLISLIAYTYPKGVKAEQKKWSVQPGDHEVCIFIEISKDERIEVFFKLGATFKDFLDNYYTQKKVAWSASSLERVAYKTDSTTFKAHFNRTLVHYNLMEFVLKTLEIDETKTYQKEMEENIYDQMKGTDILRVNEEGTALMQVRHEFVNVGESIAQVKYNTSATVTSRGTVIVSQFKQEISSRGAEVFYYKNSLGTFEGALQDAQKAFPDVNFSDIKVPPQNTQKKNPEFGKIAVSWNSSKPLEWQTLNEFDAAQNNGKPTTWDKWKIDTDKALDAFQTALDIAGLAPGLGEVADCLNGVISLARGDYADAALSFAAMVPFIGGVATGVKQARKANKAKAGVYDLIVKNGEDLKGYVGQSQDVFKRISNHFKPTKGKLSHTVKEGQEIIYKMPDSDKLEREIYEQFVILEKYQGQINPEKNPLAQLLNKVNPVGGRFDLESKAGRDIFYKKAKEIAQKYNLPTTFNPPNF